MYPKESLGKILFELTRQRRSFGACTCGVQVTPQFQKRIL